MLAGSRQPASRRARRLHRARPETSEVFEGGAYVLEHEGRTLSPEEMEGYWEDACSRYRSSRSRTAWTRRTGMVEAADRASG